MEKELLRRFLRRYRPDVRVVAWSSVIVNVLVFAGSLYMVLVYDSVLPSRSEPSLFALFAMLCLVYLGQAVVDSIRADALLAVANGVHADLSEPVRRAAIGTTLQSQRESEGTRLQRDLDSVHTFLAGSGPVAIIDLPWVILFLIVLAAFHWALGLTALLGTLILAVLAWWTSQRTAVSIRALSDLSGQRNAASHAELRFAEAAGAMGMQERLLARSARWDERFLATQSELSRVVTRLGGAGKLFRLFLQSAMLTVGAVLVIDGHASGGVILASSVLTGRALAPVDQAIANARSLTTARGAWSRIVEALSAYPRTPERSIELAQPSGDIVVRDVWIAPPGARTFALQGATFTLSPGQALAIIGPSAAGKSTLSKALLGIWHPVRGEIRINGATYDQWDRDRLGQSFGYVPQGVDLLEGTIGENIARFDTAATSEAVIAAATAAGMHATILALPDGYDTRVNPAGGELSAGQRQRIALARALYGEPFLVVLDEPNSNLDAAGDEALAAAILSVRNRGGIAVIVTHRPATLGPVSHVAVLAGGKLVDFGERDEVLQRTGIAKGPPDGAGKDPPKLVSIT